MASKYGIVFWFTSCALLLFGSPQLTMVEGLECDVCVRFSTAAAAHGGPCKGRPCNSLQDVIDAVELGRKEWDAAKEDLKVELAKELYSKLPDPDQSPRAGGLANSFACVKVLSHLTYPDEIVSGVTIDDKLMTMAWCVPQDPSDHPPRSEPYDSYSMPGVEPIKNMKKQLVYICDEKNEADCRVDDAGDKRKLGMSSDAHSALAPWILITFSCLMTAAAAHASG